MINRLKKLSEAASGREKEKRFVRTLEETAAKAVVTATVTFAVGLILKKMFERSVAQAAEEGAKSGLEQRMD
ncbi:hypothetical protein [Novosphingobium sp. KA1]|uniref:hypothetical protein n=1 Tax=Novosphingobium sp. (strain KA1) TaxID=164608 RepID=UPI001A8C3AC0|nr:hypothetical protein [Novosphingobium sp. KA1]QSR19364.1 hypothetical protein CA833_19500 [Novosphingobium sp. KA1]